MSSIMSLDVFTDVILAGGKLYSENKNIRFSIGNTLIEVFEDLNSGGHYNTQSRIPNVTVSLRQDLSSLVDINGHKFISASGSVHVVNDDNIMLDGVNINVKQLNSMSKSFDLKGIKFEYITVKGSGRLEVRDINHFTEDFEIYTSDNGVVEFNSDRQVPTIFNRLIVESSGDSGVVSYDRLHVDNLEVTNSDYSTVKGIVVGKRAILKTTDSANINITKFNDKTYVNKKGNNIIIN